MKVKRHKIHCNQCVPPRQILSCKNYFCAAAIQTLKSHNLPSSKLLKQSICRDLKQGSLMLAMPCLAQAAAPWWPWSVLSVASVDPGQLRQFLEVGSRAGASSRQFFDSWLMWTGVRSCVGRYIAITAHIVHSLLLPRHLIYPLILLTALDNIATW